MLALSENDISKAVSPREIMDSVESAMILYEKQEFMMPDRMHADYKGNTLLLMPCFTTGKFGTKLVSLFPGNAAKNIPVLYGTMVLNDGGTGEPLALLNGSALTALRTGAVGGVSIRHLTPESIQTLGIVGAGVQGLHQALFAAHARKFADIYVYDSLSEKSSSMVEKLSELRPEVRVHRADSVEDMLGESQVVVTATTSQRPVLPDKEELLVGKHFVGIGSYKPDMREFPDALYKCLDRIFVDTEHAMEESGDVIAPVENGWVERDRVVTLGKFIMENEKTTDTEGETTLFKSVGMALFDIIVSDLIYQEAVRKGLGREIEL